MIQKYNVPRKLYPYCNHSTNLVNHPNLSKSNTNLQHTINDLHESFPQNIQPLPHLALLSQKRTMTTLIDIVHFPSFVEHRIL